MKKAALYACSMMLAMVCSSSVFASDEGLAAWWKFDEGKGNAAIDSAGQIEDAISGYFKYMEGVSGSAIKLDGFTAYITRKSSDVPPLTDAFDDPDDPNILMTNLKAENKPFIIFQPGTPIESCEETFGYEAAGNHWPVTQVPNDGRSSVGPDRPSHTSLAYERAVFSKGEGVSRSIVSLYGMTTNPISKLVPVARSWVYPAQLSVTSSGFTSSGYDKYQKAYVLNRQSAGKPSVLEFNLAASKDRPVVNPAFVIKNWGEVDVNLKINDKEIARGKTFRYGQNHALECSDLIVWIKTESTRPLQVTLSPVSH